jgi:hypothetical protein
VELRFTSEAPPDALEVRRQLGVQGSEADEEEPLDGVDDRPGSTAEQTEDNEEERGRLHHQDGEEE